MNRFAFIFILFFSFSTVFAQKTENSFSVEINSKTSYAQLKEVESMVKKNYDILLSFDEVKMTNGEISSIKVSIINKNHSMMKSIQNYNIPINPFKITFKKENDSYSVSISDGSVASMLNSDFIEHRNNLSNMQEDFFPSDFSQINSHFNNFFQEIRHFFER